jgi:hypothetical protein
MHRDSHAIGLVCIALELTPHGHGPHSEGLRVHRLLVHSCSPRGRGKRLHMCIPHASLLLLDWTTVLGGHWSRCCALACRLTSALVLCRGLHRSSHQSFRRRSGPQAVQKLPMLSQGDKSVLEGLGEASRNRTDDH